MIRLLYVARAVPHKGLSDLVAALRSLDRTDWLLTVIGAIAAADAQAVSDASKWFNRRFKAIGARPLQRVAAIMRKSDALIVPSRYENFCNVALEGLACGLPVIGVATGGIRDMVTHGMNGVLFEPRDPPALASAIEWALDHKAELAAMRPAARAVAKRYSWPIIADLTSDALLAAILSRSRGDP